MRFLIIALMLFVSSCGYHSHGVSDSWVGGEAKTVYVKLFDNLTSEPYLENYLADALTIELARSRFLMLTEMRDNADLLFEGTIENYGFRATAYSSDDRITEYRSNMSVNVRLTTNESGQVVWKEPFRGNEDFFANIDKDLQQDAQRAAAKLIAKRLAEDIHSRLLDTF